MRFQKDSEAMFVIYIGMMWLSFRNDISETIQLVCNIFTTKCVDTFRFHVGVMKRVEQKASSWEFSNSWLVTLAE